MKYLGIIPARGGSKRFPRKNIAPFKGEPIIVHTIKAALNAQIFDRVIVSTEDTEIAEICGKYEVSLDLRPTELSTDTAQVKQVCTYILHKEAAEGRDYDVFVCLYPTAPMRNSSDILSVSKLINPGVCDYAMAITLSDHPVYQALQINSEGTLVPKWPDLVNIQSQKIGPLYFGNGSTYAVSSDEFLKTQSFYGNNLRGHLMPKERSVDIDYPEDLKLAQFYAREESKSFI